MANREHQLESVMRYRENNRDQYRQLMAQLLADGRRLLMEREQIQRGHDDGLEQASQSESSGVVDVTRSLGLRQHAAHQRDRIRKIDRQLGLNEQHVELCRRSLVQADQDVQVMVNLQEKRDREFNAKAQRTAQIELEDAWAGSRAAGI